MTLRQALLAAIGHHDRGEVADAAAIYRLVLTAQADNAAALNNLGLLSEPEEAVALFRRAVAADPGYGEATLNLGQALLARGEVAEAEAAYRHGLVWRPDDAALQFRLGHLLQAQGRLDEAASHYEAAVAAQPDCVAALCNLGTLHTVAKRGEAAAACYRRALAIDPDIAVANMNMVGLLEAEGRLGEAQELRARVPRPQDPVVETAPAARRTVLVLGSSKGNVPLEALLPRETTTRITWHVEYATGAQAAPDCDVAFNAIGNADIMAPSQDLVARLHARRPVLNPPDAVAATRRDRMPALLGGLEGGVVPPVVRLERAEMGEPGMVARLADAGLDLPVLVRPIVGQGGRGVVKVDTPAQWDAMGPLTADAYYVIAYRDTRSGDGFFRKYRAIFVDRQPFAYHLAISGDWLVHYFSSDMLSAPWKREEERRFLEDPAAAIGEAAWAAVARIGRRLDLDFAGVDFAVLADGPVLVFEANATMLVHLHDAVEDFPYKHRAVPRIVDAFSALLDRHAAGRGGGFGETEPAREVHGQSARITGSA